MSSSSPEETNEPESSVNSNNSCDEVGVKGIMVANSVEEGETVAQEEEHEEEAEYSLSLTELKEEEDGSYGED